MLTPLRPEPPVQILVQTLTHLVPGSGNFERTDFYIEPYLPAPLEPRFQCSEIPLGLI
jgi:hypothetical protein